MPTFEERLAALEERFRGLGDLEERITALEELAVALEDRLGVHDFLSTPPPVRIEADPMVSVDYAALELGVLARMPQPTLQETERSAGHVHLPNFPVTSVGFFDTSMTQTGRFQRPEDNPRVLASPPAQPEPTIWGNGNPCSEVPLIQTLEDYVRFFMSPDPRVTDDRFLRTLEHPTLGWPVHFVSNDLSLTDLDFWCESLEEQGTYLVTRIMVAPNLSDQVMDQMLEGDTHEFVPTPRGPIPVSHAVIGEFLPPWRRPHRIPVYEAPIPGNRLYIWVMRTYRDAPSIPEPPKTIYDFLNDD